MNFLLALIMSSYLYVGGGVIIKDKKPEEQTATSNYLKVGGGVIIKDKDKDKGGE